MPASDERRTVPNLGVSMKRVLAGKLVPKYSRLLDEINWNAHWLASVRGAGDVPRFTERSELHSFISKTRCRGGTDPIDYLEFGVYEGDSIRMWSGLNTNPSSRFFGFDSFEGLPEDWPFRLRKGAFDTNGRLPDVGDNRVDFVVGWFQESLPRFMLSFEPRQKLVVHSDSDLFSSTLYVLASLNSIIRPGTIIIFDDFNVSVDDYRALISYGAAFNRKYEIIAATTGFSKAAIEII
jgi:O-methyltransferase